MTMAKYKIIKHNPEDIIFGIFIMETLTNLCLFCYASTPKLMQSITLFTCQLAQCIRVFLPSASPQGQSSSFLATARRSTSSFFSSSSSSTLISPSRKVQFSAHRQMDQRKREAFHQHNSLRHNSVTVLGVGVGRPQPGGNLLINLHQSIFFRNTILHFLDILCDLLRPLCFVCLQVLYSAHARHLSSLPQKNIGQFAHFSLHYRLVHNISPKGSFQNSFAR